MLQAPFQSYTSRTFFVSSIPPLTAPLRLIRELAARVQAIDPCLYQEEQQQSAYYDHDFFHYFPIKTAGG
jgi:hypothetical protein